MSSLIKLESISKHYYLGENKVTALNNINFELEEGEMTALLGISGSGKSTLMNIMGFLDRPTSGRYFFRDKEVSDLKEEELAAIRNEKIGFIFQSFFLLGKSNVLQNVMLPLFYRGTPTDAAEDAARKMLAKVGISHLALHKPNQLSGGQQQRVAIARALVGDPEIILADEPTGALDSQTGYEVMNLLCQLNRDEGRTLLIITHDKDVSRLCHRSLLIKDGALMT